VPLWALESHGYNSINQSHRKGAAKPFICIRIGGSCLVALSEAPKGPPWKYLMKLLLFMAVLCLVGEKVELIAVMCDLLW